MNRRDRKGSLGLMVAVALLAAAAGNHAASAESGDEQTTVREIDIVSSKGQQRVILRGDQEGPVVLRTVLVRRAWLGVGLLDITPELRHHFGVPDESAGILVSKVEEDSPAARAGVEVGDVLVSIDGHPVSRGHHLVAELGERESGEVVRLEGWRQGRPVTFTAELDETQRSQVDVTPFLAGGPRWETVRSRLHGPGEGHHEEAEHLGEVLELHESALNEAFENLEIELEPDRMGHHLLRFQEDRGGLLERIEELEERLRDLEREIDELPEDEN